MCLLPMSLTGGLFANSTTWESESEVAQSCLTLWDPMDCIAYQTPPSVGFFQARVLEWVAISFSTWEVLHIPVLIHFFRFFSHIDYYKTLGIVPCAIQ